MSQKIINVGTVANDGTGDTIRGAFTNVNANFTEVYGNIVTLTAGLASIDSEQNTAIAESYNTANAAFNQANSANVLAYNTGIGANLYSIDVGTAGNAYAVSVASSANTYSQTVGTAGNNYTNTVGSAGNNYASILSANNAIGANAWANTVAVSTYEWANATFTTQSNTSLIFNTTNSAFIRANASLSNTTGTFAGNLFITGTLSDSIGPIREKLANTVVSNLTIQVTETVIIANNGGMSYIKVPDDNNFLLPANVGTTVEIFQYGSGTTKIMANDASVTINSPNNWSNISGQYLAATLVKIQSNTWLLTGNLKA